jgi:MFS family permease
LNFDFHKNSKILLKASIFSNFGFGLFAPISAIFVQKIGGSLLDIGFAYALYCIFTGIFVICFGNSKFYKKNIRKMVVFGYAFQSLCYLGYIFVSSPIHLFIVQIFLGMTAGILEPAWDAVFSAKQSEKEEGRSWVMWTGSINFVAGISAIIGSLIASFSFNLIFIIMAVCTAVSAIIASRILK